VRVRGARVSGCRRERRRLCGSERERAGCGTGGEEGGEEESVGRAWWASITYTRVTGQWAAPGGPFSLDGIHFGSPKGTRGRVKTRATPLRFGTPTCKPGPRSGPILGLKLTGFGSRPAAPCC